MKLDEIVHMIMDELKLTVDDSYFNLDHVLFLVNNYRAMLLQQRYADPRHAIPLSNFQAVELSVEHLDRCTWRSVERVPPLVNRAGFEQVRVSPAGDFADNLIWTFVSKDRFRVAGTSKWLSNFAYFTIGPDERLHFKSAFPGFRYLKKLRMEAIFEDVYAVMEMQDRETGIEEREYPLEHGLVPFLVQAVCKELGSVLYSPVDDKNNAADDLPNVSTTRAANSSRDYRNGGQPQEYQQQEEIQ
jgi:hypothetical protein